MDIVDLLVDESEINREEVVMEEHEIRVAHMSVSLKGLSSHTETTIKMESKELDILRQRLANVEKNAGKVNAMIGPTPGPNVDCCLLEQYNKQVIGFQMELLDISHCIATMEDAKELPDEEFRISDAMFCMGLKISKLLSSAQRHLPCPLEKE